MLETISLSNHRILVAEPNAWDTRQIISMLRAFGAYDILVASRDSETMRIIEEQLPDLIIVGERRPQYDGRKLVQAIRSHKLKPVNHIPVIYVVNIARRRHMESLARFGVHEVICKPFSTRTLIDRIYWTIMVQRPFIRSRKYFGPEPRTVFWKQAIGMIGAVPERLNFVADGRASARAPVVERTQAPASQVWLEDIDIVEL